ncbi:ricin-type beta-trefoil lectin domain protein [Streptomyces sp. FH025]|uniref:ricin-type beta-trefoil lectin domain protein n=1 Tax=Streptomyces sp. FH025 TaxID=2815937 RepID=UPI001A9E652E|nr:ricin-type beta-trefoil lectin domain protein [Streptomyces sp. FH025]MBO1416274.1 ricin-type beta-trefoil lectin domain protein [Streptomyces sp. FH025]
MYSIKKAAAAVVAVLAVTGAVTAAAPASAGQVRQAGGNVRFFNEATGGSLDANGSGAPVAITWQPNGTAFQDWILRPLGPVFLIESVARRGSCLQAPPNSGDVIRLAPCNPNNPTQAWELDRVGDKFVIAEATDENFVIEATSNTNPVVKQFRDENPNQLWDVTPS